ncbi:hypothetical protein BV898_17846 [Hypsibius exemplaris]|uniref:Uncharacterized protein n=1 Tax=Hypsibius exemplaris TaxID=2072580 RepID=A0A9X6NIQ9_HYPEX|nr:hypothetical protein BV898_17846 [Hypsibius exemplaris]
MPWIVSECRMECLADDTKIYAADKTREEAVTKLNTALQVAATRFEDNLLPLNEKVRKLMLIASQKSRSTTNNTNGVNDVILNGCRLEEMDAITYLSIIVDYYLI